MHFYQHQIEAIDKLHNGAVLLSPVGSGKSITALGYYSSNYGAITKLIIITTAKKRDSKEWEKDLLACSTTAYDIESWNNIDKFILAKNCFFIFDEQKTVGRGAWSKTFIKIAKCNDWIMLSATPGDCYYDYAALLVANGFYRNFSEYDAIHTVYPRYSKWASKKQYRNEDLLRDNVESILVRMPYSSKNLRNYSTVVCDYDANEYSLLKKEFYDRGDNITQILYNLRKLSIIDNDRMRKAYKIIEKHRKVIIFYNYDYEIMLFEKISFDYAIRLYQYNGHKHDQIPEDKEAFIYAVQYNSGSEGWECRSVDTIIFYSMNYSWKTFEQCCGRIDRPCEHPKHLYYYTMTSCSNIDRHIEKIVFSKEKFNLKIFGEII